MLTGPLSGLLGTGTRLLLLGGPASLAGQGLQHHRGDLLDRRRGGVDDGQPVALVHRARRGQLGAALGLGGVAGVGPALLAHPVQPADGRGQAEAALAQVTDGPGQVGGLEANTLCLPETMAWFASRERPNSPSLLTIISCEVSDLLNRMQRRVFFFRFSST